MDRHKKVFAPQVVLLLLLIILTGCGGGFSDSSDVYGKITVRTIDDSLLGFEGAAVSVDFHTTSTDSDGDYRIYNLEEGEYTWKVEAEGFNTYEEPIYVVQGEDYEKNHTLEPVDTYHGIAVGTVNIHNSTGYTATVTSQDLKIPNTHKTSSFRTCDPVTRYKEGEILIKYRPIVSIQSVDNIAAKQGLSQVERLSFGGGRIVRYRIPEGKSVEEMVSYFQHLPDVEWAEPNYIVHATAIPSDEMYLDGYQWGHVSVNLEAAWDKETGSSGVVVAVIDTGIVEHEDLNAHIIYGEDFIDGDNRPIDETPKANDGSHGTHVAGIIGAVTNNSEGVAGVNWDVAILVIRVLDTDGTGDIYNVAKGIKSAVDYGGDGADIINLSLGMSIDYSNTLKDAVDYAYDHGVTVIASAGNDGDNSILYPAAYENTIAVGAVNYYHQLAQYSNYGPELDLVAPGGGEVTGYNTKDYIWSTWGYYEEGQTYPGYAGMIGTSMAAPYVSGVAALLMAYSGITDPDAIKARLTSTAVDLGEEGKDYYYGYGLVDAYGALLNKKLPNPVVFAAEKINNTLYSRSEPVTADRNGNFLLKQVEPGEWYLVAWRDVDESGTVNAGDYFGITDQTVTFAGGRVSPADIEMYYVGKESTTALKVSGFMQQ